MNLRVAFDAVDEKYWKMARQGSYVPRLKACTDLVEALGQILAESSVWDDGVRLLFQLPHICRCGCAI